MGLVIIDENQEVKIPDTGTVITATGCKMGVSSAERQSKVGGSCASSVVMVGMKAV